MDIFITRIRCGIKVLLFFRSPYYLRPFYIFFSFYTLFPTHTAPVGHSCSSRGFRSLSNGGPEFAARFERIHATRAGVIRGTTLFHQGGLIAGDVTIFNPSDESKMELGKKRVRGKVPRRSAPTHPPAATPASSNPLFRCVRTVHALAIQIFSWYLLQIRIYLYIYIYTQTYILYIKYSLPFFSLSLSSLYFVETHR